MQPRGYSDFFKSGFFAIINRSYGKLSSTHNPDVMLNTSKTTSSKRRPRPVSMIVQNTPRDKARRRRSSFLSFPSQWFDHKLTTTSFNEKHAKSRNSSGSSLRAVDSDDSLPEGWITAGDPYTPSSLNGSSDEVVHRSIDPFSSSPDAKSTFLDFLQDDPLLSTPKRDSFLSFTPSSNRSSIIIRRERPLSIQTIPPLPPRQSSLQYHYYPLVQEKPDFFRVVEGDIDLLSSEVMEVDHEEWDAPAKIDWRQFHVDVLTDDM